MIPIMQVYTYGVFTIKFSNKLLFNNGFGVIIYKVIQTEIAEENETELKPHNTFYTVKDFFNQNLEPEPKENGTVWFIKGSYLKGSYLNKQTQLYVEDHYIRVDDTEGWELYPEHLKTLSKPIDREKYKIEVQNENAKKD